MPNGPQLYPKADASTQFYGGKFNGSLMEVNVGVIHTTEGTSFPDYGGGGSAPTITAKPDFGAQKLVFRQHFNIDTSARALVNASGGVETNTLNVFQIELVGTCDPATHRKWAAAGYNHIFWPEAPDWALRDLAELMKWLNVNHGIPLTSGLNFAPYPSSYANGAGQRMSFAKWQSFKGWCGHQHVPENSHGDPGNFPIDKVLAMAKGTTSTPKPPTTTPSTGDTYTVRSGDTLSGIGAKLGIKWLDIAKANNLKSPYTIAVGQKLKLPGKSSGGSVTPSQIVALNSAVKPGATHAQVAELQQLLIKAGYGPIPGAVTKFYGKNTGAAVARFYRKNPKLANSQYDTAIGPKGFIELQKEAGRK
ncbi:endolysin [Streptomyces phage Yasdnil]|uniref:Endolysin n=1 Tax=Streptomyces phage Yasdnil TaxID=2593360 RepID=A0A514U4D7_9CAUD|nr:endolysin [Streptomyces phage Yasdnil]QDK03196.1 endolysin [Streptomyces phage TuanPN]QDK03750.1 endolysin [Streptomyces phage Yasdnil]USH46035.1 endolysin [Streptomyces phage Ejemplo]